jgi:hypothetical protein
MSDYYTAPQYQPEAVQAKSTMDTAAGHLVGVNQLSVGAFSFLAQFSEGLNRDATSFFGEQSALAERISYAWTNVAYKSARNAGKK